MNDPQVRQCFLGGSDAPAALGLSQYKQPLEVWMEKVGMAPPTEFKEAMYWGTALQPVILAEFSRRTGKQLISIEERHYHPEFNWMVATVDAAICPEEIVEGKTCGVHSAKDWGEPGTDEIPESYLVQTTHQMAVTGAQIVWVPLLIGGQEFRVYKVERNEALIQMVMEKEAEFWDMVLKRTPPDPDWASESTPAILNALYKPRAGYSVQLGEQAMKEHRVYDALGRGISRLEEKRKMMKAKLIAEMKEASEAELPDGTLLTRKAIERKAYSVEATTYIEFRSRKPKKARARS